MEQNKYTKQSVSPAALTLILEKLERFEVCAGDENGCDIGREWFDALTTLGLLERTQRSPALWSMTPAGEALLAAQPAEPAPVDRPFKRYAALDAAMDQASKQMDRLDAYLDENSHAAAADNAAVDAFAVHMKEKLATARKKGRGGWQQCTPEDLSGMLREHVEKGDPRDVANFCMFLHALGHGIQRVDRQGVALSDEESIMTKIQEFASTWAVVGGRFDDGSAMERAEECKAEIRAILSRASSSRAEVETLQARIQELKELNNALAAASIVPDDCALVPREPTDKMMLKGGFSFCGRVPNEQVFPEVRKIWYAMLAAAEAPNAEKGE